MRSLWMANPNASSHFRPMTQPSVCKSIACHCAWRPKREDPCTHSHALLYARLPNGQHGSSSARCRFGFAWPWFVTRMGWKSERRPGRPGHPRGGHSVAVLRKEQRIERPSCAQCERHHMPQNSSRPAAGERERWFCPTSKSKLPAPAWASRDFFFPMPDPFSCHHPAICTPYTPRANAH